MTLNNLFSLSLSLSSSSSLRDLSLLLLRQIPNQEIKHHTLCILPVPHLLQRFPNLFDRDDGACSDLHFDGRAVREVGVGGEEGEEVRGVGEEGEGVEVLGDLWAEEGTRGWREGGGVSRGDETKEKQESEERTL